MEERNQEAAKRPSVLVIDDDALIGRMLKRILRNCEVTVDRDPTTAVRRFVQGERFDLILCDLHMPEAAGSDVLLAAKTTAPELAERFVVMTGGSTGRDDEHFLRECGVRVLTKPFNAEELAAVVAWAVSRKGDA